MAPPGMLYLGGTRRLDGGGCAAPLYLPAHHLATHGVGLESSGGGGEVGTHGGAVAAAQ